MSWRSTRVGWVLLPALLLCGPAPVGADGRFARPRPERCTPAHFQDIRLPFPVTVDEIRVVVADHSPAAGAVTITVDAGPFDRVLRVRGPLSRRLSFAPALSGQVFHVSLDPVFEAPTSACIERVELVRAGVPVAVVEP